MPNELTREQAEEFHAGVAEFGRKEGFGAARAAGDKAAECRFARYAGSLLNLHFIVGLKEIKESASYKLETDPDTGKPFTWEDYCPKRLNLSRPSADDRLKLLDTYGPEFVEALGGLRIGHSRIRLLIAAPQEAQAKLIEASKAGPDREEQLRATIDGLSTQLTRKNEENRKLSSTLDQKNAEIDKRKASEARQEDEIRARDKRIRELESGWAPSAEEAAARAQLAETTGTIDQSWGRLIVIASKPGQHMSVLKELHGYVTTHFGVEDSRVTDLLDQIKDAINRQARSNKEGGRK